MNSDLFDSLGLFDLIRQHLDSAILGILGFMSFLLLAYTIERLLFFARNDIHDYADRHTLEVALTRHLTALASIASNAPYIGLLGTVLGILVTFHDLSQGDQFSAGAVMLGLALALKATAAGLVVAIPATLIYNGMLRQVEVQLLRWRGLQGET